MQKITGEPNGRRWGSGGAAPWWIGNPTARDGQPVGEVWLKTETPVLVKYLFSASDLSVQVHPDDKLALELEGGPNGKTEMWHVLAAEPGARVAMGLNRNATEEELRSACLSGEIVEMLNWIPARSGDTFFMPARTIHAIGGGLTICEIQQVSDITYRLYDWGRQESELHLEKGIRASKLEATPASAANLPIDCEYFHADKFEVAGQKRVPADQGAVLVAISGRGRVGGLEFGMGDVFEARGGSVEIEAERAVFLTCGAAARARA